MPAHITGAATALPARYRAPGPPTARRLRATPGPPAAQARPDGFRELLAPQLRGEGNWAGVALGSAAEARAQAAAEALLGTLPFWHAAGPELAAHAAALEALAAARTPAALGAALLQTEALLEKGGRLGGRWRYWRPAWRHLAAALPSAGFALSLLASLQEHLVPDPGALPRSGFQRIAREARCELYLPQPGEPVVLLRTGAALHVRRCRQALGLAPADAGAAAASADPGPRPAADSPAGACSPARAAAAMDGGAAAGPPDAAASDAGGLPSRSGEPARSGSGDAAGAAKGGAAAAHSPGGSGAGDDAAAGGAIAAHGPGGSGAGGDAAAGGARIAHSGSPSGSGAGAGAGGSGSGEDDDAGTPASAPRRLAGGRRGGAGAGAGAPPVPAAAQEAVRAQWEALGEAVAGLRPFERFRVVSVAYRRTLLDGGAAADPAAGHCAADAAGAAAWPTAWVLLRPAAAGPGAAGALYGPGEAAAGELAVPLRADGALPDCLVRADAFDRGMQRAWRPGDRFRMLFAGRGGWRAGGAYYHGAVREVLAARPPPGAPAAQRLAYDPWEALAVAWDARKGGAEGAVERVGAWELEPDDAGAEQRAEAARRAEEAASRAARASALAARRGEDAPEAPPGALPGAPAPARWPAEPADAQTGADGQAGAAAAAPQAPPRRSEADDGAVPAGVLDALRPLGRDAFVTLLGNWTRGVKGKFKVPIFAHRELDLRTVFWAVQERRGYDAVSGAKLWKARRPAPRPSWADPNPTPALPHTRPATHPGRAAAAIGAAAARELAAGACCSCGAFRVLKPAALSASYTSACFVRQFAELSGLGKRGVLWT